MTKVHKESDALLKVTSARFPGGGYEHSMLGRLPKHVLNAVTWKLTLRRSKFVFAITCALSQTQFESARCAALTKGRLFCIPYVFEGSVIVSLMISVHPVCQLQARLAYK